LIGHSRSRRAAEIVFERANLARRESALLEIQQQSGSLPDSLSWGVRANVTLEWIVKRFKTRPAVLLSAFLMIFLGAGLPFGLKEYLSISGSGFMNMLNILLSLERGALLGAPFGVAVLLTRLIAERFPEVKAHLRILLSTVIGGFFLSISIFTYDVLVLTTIPDGFLYIAGCLLIAFGYALGSLQSERWWKFVVSAIALFAALAGSWWSYLFLAESSFALTPVFFYRVSWSPTQIIIIILTLTLSMSVSGNLSDLSFKEETY